MCLTILRLVLLLLCLFGHAACAVLECDASRRSDCVLSRRGATASDILHIRNRVAWLTIHGLEDNPDTLKELLYDIASLQSRPSPLINCPAAIASLQALQLLEIYGVGGVPQHKLPSVPRPLSSVLCSGWPLFGILNLISESSQCRTAAVPRGAYWMSEDEKDTAEVGSQRTLGQHCWADLHTLQCELDLIGPCPFPSIAVPIFLDNPGLSEEARICSSGHGRGDLRGTWDPSGVDNEIFKHGRWEECDNLLAALREFPPGCTIVDVGANIGACTMAFASNGFKVIAFEPIPRNLARLKASVELSRQASAVEMQGLVVSDKSGIAHIVPNGPYSRVTKIDTNRTEHAPARASAEDDGSSEEHIHVLASTLDAAVHEACNVCALKIDAEGSEGRVFRGAQRLLQIVRVVDFEFVPQILREEGENPEGLLHMLDKLGYTIWHSPDTLLRARPPLRSTRSSVLKGWALGQIPRNMFALVAEWQPPGFQLIALRNGSLPSECRTE